MTDELKAAAERWRTAGKSREQCDEIYGNRHLLMDDMELLADHAASLFDSEPITEEWLWSVGFSGDRMGCPTLGALHIQPHPFQKPGSNCEYPAYACIRSLPIPVPKTRDDVVRLCEVLGVNLKGNA